MAHIYRVVRAHKPDPAEPLVLRKGETVPFERKQTAWEGCKRPANSVWQDRVQGAAIARGRRRCCTGSAGGGELPAVWE